MINDGFVAIFMRTAILQEIIALGMFKNRVESHKVKSCNHLPLTGFLFIYFSFMLSACGGGGAIQDSIPEAPVVIFQENFDNISATSLPWNGIAGNDNVNIPSVNFTKYFCSQNGPPPSVQIVSGEGRSGSNTAKMNYSPGGTFDAAFNKLGTNAGYLELFIKAYVKLQGSFPWGGSDDLKLFRWYIGSKHIIPVFSTNVPPRDGNHRLKVDVGGGVLASNSSWSLESHDSGAWYCHEIHVKLNTPGQFDGVLEYWIDGNIIISDPAWAPRASGDHSLMWSTGDSFSIGGNIPGGPSSISSLWYDDIVISNQRIQ